MSVSNEINRISNNVKNALNAVEEQGVAVPASANSDNLAELISRIGNDCSISVSKTGSVSTLTVTDKNGTQSVQIEDGEDGDDGTSVTVKSVSESTADGGSNVVTFSDGKTITIKNGSKGSTGADGAKGDKGDQGVAGVGIKSVTQTTTSSADGGSNVITVTKTDNTTSTFTVKNGSKGSKGDKGDTPVKGTDYWTETDKVEIIENTKNVCVAKNQGSENVGKILVVGTDGNLTLIDMPEASGDVTGVLDESNNILLSGNLADGTYTLKYENEDGTYTEIGTLEVGATTPTYTNLAEPTDSNWIVNGRIGSDGTNREDMASLKGHATNFIAVKAGDIVRVKGGDCVDNGYYQVGYSTNVVASTNKVVAEQIKSTTNNTYFKDASVTNGISQFTIVSDSIKYIRLTLINVNDVNDVIITVNEEIIDENTSSYTNFAEPNDTNTTDWSIWINNARVGSDGTYRSDEYVGGSGTPAVSNYIAVQNGDIVEYEGIYTKPKSSVLYDSSKGDPKCGALPNLTQYLSDVSEDGTNYSGQFAISNASIAYVRIGGYVLPDLKPISIKIKRNGKYL